MKKVVFAICCVIASYSDVFSMCPKFEPDIERARSEADFRMHSCCTCIPDMREVRNEREVCFQWIHIFAEEIAFHPDSLYRDADMRRLVLLIGKYFTFASNDLIDFNGSYSDKICKREADKLIQQKRDARKALSSKAEEK